MGRVLLLPICTIVLFAMGCEPQASPPDFQKITRGFTSARASGVTTIKIGPIETGTFCGTLNTNITLTDTNLMTAILGQLKFVPKPIRPREIDHLGVAAACKITVGYGNGQHFYIAVWMLNGAESRTGTDYAMLPDSTVNTIFGTQLPLNNRLGRGFSVSLYEMIQFAIEQEGAFWVRNIPSN